MLIKFVSKNEADQTLQLFGNITVDGVEYKGLKSYKKFSTITSSYNINQKVKIIIETFWETTRKKFSDKGKMTVITLSRLITVRYY